MLVQVDGCSSPVLGSRAPSILDSPTLARVERARLRHEAGDDTSSVLMFGQIPPSSVLGDDCDEQDGGFRAIKRGLLWQQRDRLFSRWKERYFVLTRDYLQCFKRASQPNRISDMGRFIFKVKLVDVERVEWHNRKTYSVISLAIGGLGGTGTGGRVLLRAPPGTNSNGTEGIGEGLLEDWFEMLERCMIGSKQRRQTLVTQHYSRRGSTETSTPHMDDWLLPRKKNGSNLFPTHSDSVPDLEEVLAIHRREHRWAPQDDDWRSTANSHRLSLLTDIDIAAACDSSGGDSPPSVASTYRGSTGGCSRTPPLVYRLNQDVYCLPPSTQLHQNQSHQVYQNYKQEYQNQQNQNHKSNQKQHNQFYQHNQNQDHQNNVQPNQYQNFPKHYHNGEGQYRCIDGVFVRGQNQGRSSFHTPHRAPNQTVVASRSGVFQTRPEQPAQYGQPQIVRYRERSYSDIQRLDKKSWKRVEDQRLNSHFLNPAQG